MISLFCWNIANPSTIRALRQVEWFENLKYDVFIFTEVKNSAGTNVIRDYFLDRGYYIYLPDIKDNKYGVMITSKYPVKPTIFMESNKFLKERLVSLDIILPDYKFEIISCYVPSRDVSQEKMKRKNIFLDSIERSFKKNLSNAPRIFCGDLNIVEQDHEPHYSFFKDWEYKFYLNLEKYFLIDVFRKLYPLNKGYSWIGKTGNGYRYDYFFVTPSIFLTVSKCVYIQEPRLKKLSDHAAISLHFSK